MDYAALAPLFLAAHVFFGALYKPKAGFYHVKTSDGTEGWIGVNYLSVEGQAAAASTPSSTPSAASAGAAGCDATLWNHVYHQQRLKVLKDCLTVSGKLHIVRTEPDGDIHVQLTLDLPITRRRELPPIRPLPDPPRRCWREQADYTQNPVNECNGDVTPTTRLGFKAICP